MASRFFEQPIINSPYDYPTRHWKLDEHGQPTQDIIESRRSATFVSPIPRPRRRTPSNQSDQLRLSVLEDAGLSTDEQEYDVNRLINEMC